MAKTARRDPHAGALFQRASDSRWVAYVTLPDRDGKRRRKVKTHKTKAGASKLLAEMRRELDRSGDLPTASPTLEAWMRLWLDDIAAPRLKPRTLETYRGYVDRWIVPVIGKRRLDKLAQGHVRELHDAMTRAGLSSTSALQAHRILARALKDAEREGRVTKNVATLVDAPQKAVSVRDALSADDARALLASVASDPSQAVHWAIALLAGLRQGERLGLTRDAVDLDAGIITVSWQLQRLKWTHGCAGKCGKARAGSCPERHVPIPAGQEAHQIHGGLWLTRPKSRAGWRQVPMAPLLLEVMRRHLASTEPGVGGLVLHRGDGKPIDPRDDAAAWDAALAAAGLPDVPLHSARHTTSTLLYELGVDEQTRVKILGHSSATVTRGYTHITDVIAHDAMSKLGTLLAPQIES